MSLFYNDKEETIKLDNIIIVGVLFALLLIAVFGAFYTVPVGHRGILLTWGGYSATMSEGFHFKIPIAQSVVLMNVQTQKYEATASAATRDLLDVSTKAAVNYHIEPAIAGQVYQKIGIDYENRVISPAVQEVVKSVTAKYQAKDLITNRSAVKSQIDDSLAARLQPYDIVLETVSITDFEFPQTFNDAILQAQTATQNAIQAENQLKVVQFQAQQAVAAAQGQADAKLAIAIAEAKSIQIQGEALKNSPQVAELRWISQWDGHIPPFYGTGGGVVPIVQMPSSFLAGVLNTTGS